MRKSAPVISLACHLAAVLLLLAAAITVAPPPVLSPQRPVMTLHLVPPRLNAPQREEESGGGQSLPPPRGEEPVRRPHKVFVPPMVARNDQPKLTVDIGLEDAPMSVSLAGIGDPLGLLDFGQIGTGQRPGFGRGNAGEGLDEGSGKGFRSSQPAPKVTRKPEVLHKEEPEYSEAARKAHVQGTVRLSMDVGLDGRAMNIRVISGVGLGLEEKAIEAVRKWLFRPALAGDRPVVAGALVDVSFSLL